MFVCHCGSTSPAMSICIAQLPWRATRLPVTYRVTKAYLCGEDWLAERAVPLWKSMAVSGNDWKGLCWEMSRYFRSHLSGPSKTSSQAQLSESAPLEWSGAYLPRRPQPASVSEKASGSEVYKLRGLAIYFSTRKGAHLCLIH